MATYGKNAKQKQTGGIEEHDVSLMTVSYPFVPSTLGTLIQSGDGTWTFSPNPGQECDAEPLVSVSRVGKRGRHAAWAGPRCLLIWAPYGWKFSTGHVVGAADDECLWWVEPREVFTEQISELPCAAPCSADRMQAGGMEDWSSWGEALWPYIKGVDGSKGEKGKE
jgi:hypothetical protein